MSRPFVSLVPKRRHPTPLPRDPVGSMVPSLTDIGPPFRVSLSLRSQKRLLDPDGREAHISCLSTCYPSSDRPGTGFGCSNAADMDWHVPRRRRRHLDRFPAEMGDKSQLWALSLSKFVAPSPAGGMVEAKSSALTEHVPRGRP